MVSLVVLHITAWDLPIDVQILDIEVQVVCVVPAILALSADMNLNRSCLGEPGRVIFEVLLLCVWISTSVTVMLVVTSQISELALSFLPTSSLCRCCGCVMYVALSQN